MDYEVDGDRSEVDGEFKLAGNGSNAWAGWIEIGVKIIWEGDIGDRGPRTGGTVQGWRIRVHLVHWMIITLGMVICITSNRRWCNGITIHINTFGCKININIYIYKQRPHAEEYKVLPCGALIFHLTFTITSFHCSPKNGLSLKTRQKVLKNPSPLITLQIIWQAQASPTCRRKQRPCPQTTEYRSLKTMVFSPDLVST